ncbi:3-isopropylmalate dehydratase large subunit [Patescibacteria group bacterium]|nr:3-isopropylmalate dehydratase large subunit [Patescibacteria group bacterium]MBU1683078.1 3-isopropylmalate dehydratase large subunit [Patescibacteria group bacterium]MBU1935161.1 3-isopropylmalate dehydratase large subunit [Patescibacteria group bacterium]
MANIFYKIIARNLGRVPKKNEYIEIDTDYALVHDGTLVLTRLQFEKFNTKKVWDKDRIIVVFDHIVPANNIKTANLNNLSREFVKKHKIKNFFEGGDGICHQVVLEEGITSPGDILMGADSHTGTAGAIGVMGIGIGATDMAYIFATGKTWLKVVPAVLIKYKGKPKPGVGSKDIIFATIKKIGVDFGNYKFISYQSKDHDFSMDDRAVFCNLSVEYGAKSAIYEDAKHPYHSDSDEDFDEVVEIDLAKIKPHLVEPYTLADVKAVDERKKKIPVDVVFVGTCAGGRLSDIEEFAKGIKGKVKNPGTRVIVGPASKKVYKDAMKAGYFEKIIDFGGTVLSPGCGPCLGLHSGVLGDGEVCVSTGNRNFKGRMGSTEAKIFLTSPGLAAISAVTGKI